MRCPKSEDLNEKLTRAVVAEALALTMRRSEEPQYLYVQIFTGCVFIVSAVVLGCLPLWNKKGLKSSMEKN